MDLGTLVNYEATYDLRLKHPVTEADTGVVFKIRSEWSEAGLRAARAAADDEVARAASGGGAAMDAAARQRKVFAACIAGWDWGTETYNGSVPEYSPEMAERILTRTHWIYVQVMEAARKIANFTEA